MPVVGKKAAYQEKSYITEFIGNPLIAALPETVSQSDMLHELLELPPYREEERQNAPSDRLRMLSRICAVHVPYDHDLYIARKLYRCINWGYVPRNPMPFSVTAKVLSAYQRDVTPELENYLTGAVFHVFGFPVIGVSGAGKSSSVLNALRHFPQVIEHDVYQGHPFNSTQLVWLKADCPEDGNLKGLSMTILREIDAVLGTSYHTEISNRISKDVLPYKVYDCISAHHLGALVIDDIQNLCGARKKTFLEVFSFLTCVTERYDIPVVMVGTPRVLSLFQQEFHIARRAMGDGMVRMDLMKKGSAEWERFIGTIWHFQFTGNEVPLTPEMNDAFFEESVGNPFLCSLLYKLVQDDAIISGEESFSVADVRKVAEEKLHITAEMRRNMLSGNDEELKKYGYLWQPAEL